MFNFKSKTAKHIESVAELQEELRKSKQEREAARLGLTSAVVRLMRAAQEFPLDEKMADVAKDLAAVGSDDNGRT